MIKKFFIKLYIFNLIILGGVFCYILIVKAIIPIWSVDNNEQDKKNVIGMKQSVLSEFNKDGTPFWWLENGKNYLWFTNDSDEAIRGTINLYVSKNPCGINQKLSLDLNSTRVSDFQLDDDLTKVSIDVNKIDPFSRIEVLLSSVNFVECVLNNGDNRQLIAKLEYWSFD